jgi:hypothetical protein
MIKKKLLVNPNLFSFMSKKPSAQSEVDHMVEYLCKKCGEPNFLTPQRILEYN